MTAAEAACMKKCIDVLGRMTPKLAKGVISNIVAEMFDKGVSTIRTIANCCKHMMLLFRADSPQTGQGREAWS